MVVVTELVSSETISYPTCSPIDHYSKVSNPPCKCGTVKICIEGEKCTVIGSKDYEGNCEKV